MTPEQWKEIERLYQTSRELQTAQRAQFLSDVCADEDVRREVESLLAHSDVLSLVDRPALDVAGEMVTGYDSGTLVGRTIDSIRFSR